MIQKIGRRIQVPITHKEMGEEKFKIFLGIETTSPTPHFFFKLNWSEGVKNQVKEKLK